MHKEIWLSPHCEECIDDPNLLITWCSNKRAHDECEICERGPVRYVIDKRHLKGRIDD